VQADVGLAGSCCGRRIDVTHVVADLVGAQLRELCPDPDTSGAAVTRERPRHQAVDRDVKGFDQRLRDRARALSRRGRLE
jgi:hypothetical protein